MSVEYIAKCPVCKGQAKINKDDSFYNFVNCDSCGYYLIKNSGEWEGKPKDFDKLASYLYYNGNINPPMKDEEEEFFNIIGIKSKYTNLSEEGQCCFLVTDDIVENWYPKTFSEKVDIFLLGLAQKSTFMGDPISLSSEEWFAACFVKRSVNGKECSQNELARQVNYFMDYLAKEKYVDYSGLKCMILPEGQKRIDDLQKKEAENSKNIFVAMAFSEDMKPVREAIREAIISCGYVPRIMDEIQHNHQIVPEMLYEIRKAKCVIAELSNHNNGAYYEAGFALGTGKEVIHLCRKSSFGADGHFDVKQINTILWDSEEEIVKKLADRIKATIG